LRIDFGAMDDPERGLLLIALRDSAPGEVVIRVEGEIVGPGVDELATVCEQQFASRATVRLDLKDVAFVDRRGIALLRSLVGRGARLLKCSPFTAELLKR